jgi:ATP-dependent DNA ligase
MTEAQKVGFLFDKLEIKFNTDANGNVKPMLATDWKKVKSITYPCYIQPKLDGVRCLMIVERSGPDMDVTFLSRSGKPYTTLQHIADDVMENAGPNPFILDGEVYSSELTFQEITQAVKKQCPNSLKLQFRAYDVVTEHVQADRYDILMDLMKLLNSNCVTWVPTLVANHEQYIRDYHDDWVRQGYEGAMIRLFDGVYGQGQRSRHLLKVKEFDETEFDFYQWETGQREEDLIAVLFNKSGVKFKAKMTGTREHKEKLRKHTGGDSKMTVKHFGYTDDGLPRFPIGKAFRDYE